MTLGGLRKMADISWEAEGFIDTFAFEIEKVTLYEIYDPGRARIVATFTDRKEAEAYVAARESFIESLED